MATSAGPRYAVSVTGDVVTWDKIDGLRRVNIATSNFCGFWSTGEALGVSVSGLGANTVVEVWKSPTGPFRSWGPPTCALTTGCGFDCVDSGNYVGAVAVDVIAPNHRSFDDFEAGAY